MLKTFFQLFCVVAALLTACGCSSFSETLSESDLSVLELEERMFQAADPGNRYSNARSYVMRQQVETEKFLELPEKRMIETRYLHPDNLKITTFNDNVPETSLIVTGKSAWAVDYASRRIRPIPEKDLTPMVTMTRINDPRSRYHEIFEEVKIDQAEVDGEIFYRLTCLNPGGSPIYIYVDRDTYLVRRLRSSFKTSYGTVELDGKMKSYSLYEGIQIANESESIQDGLQQNIRVIDYQLNAPIRAEEFAPPIL